MTTIVIKVMDKIYEYLPEFSAMFVLNLIFKIEFMNYKLIYELRLDYFMTIYDFPI